MTCLSIRRKNPDKGYRFFPFDFKSYNDQGKRFIDARDKIRFEHEGPAVFVAAATPGRYGAPDVFTYICSVGGTVLRKDLGQSIMSLEEATAEYPYEDWEMVDEDAKSRISRRLEKKSP